MSFGPNDHMQQRVLLLVGQPGLTDQIRDALQGFETHIAGSTDEALRAIRTQRFDFAIGTLADVLALGRAAGQPTAEAVLEHIGQGIAIVDSVGRPVWSNARLRSFSESVQSAIFGAIAELILTLPAHAASADGPFNLSRNLTIAAEYSFNIFAAPLPAVVGGAAQFVALVIDTTANQRLLEKIDAIDSAGRALVNLDADATARLDVGERLRLLEDHIIRYCRELLRFDHFAVRVIDPKTNRLETVLAGGFPEEAKSLPIYAEAEGNGISGHVAATGQSYLCSDVSQDPRYLPGIEGARSSLTVPLRVRDQIVGILNVESDQLAGFSEYDRQFAEIFGRYIGLALFVLKLLAVERYTATGQVASDVASELALPLNDIVGEATHLMDELAAVAPAARQRLSRIIDLVDQTKKTLHSATRMPGITGLVPESHTTDPVIGGKRVLIADDEDIIRETVADVLTKLGAITVMASDGETAVAMLRSQRFDLVLSDIKMPNRNGYEVFSAAKAANAAIPVILITGFGYDPEHSIVRASKEGLAGVLFKPFRVEQLMQAARTALGAPAGS